MRNKKELKSVQFMVGLVDLRGLFQPKSFCDQLWTDMHFASSCIY